MDPKQVGLAETMAFLGRFPFAVKPRVLEVGCGTGELAARLNAHGWQMVAIDVDAAAVSVAKTRGVDAVVADLRAFESEPFDVVIFASSLHHIDPLDLAVDRALRLVKPGGWLFLEEFAIEDAGRPEAGWLYDRQDLLEEAGLLHGEGPRLQILDPVERWKVGHHQAEGPGHGHGHHAHEHQHAVSGHAAVIHPAAKMRTVVEERFKVMFTERAPYLYRYLIASLEASVRGERIARLLLEQERRSIEDGTLRPLGFRIAARNED